ncbi:MAG: flagellar basal body L-ring protein FlgH [Humidesulfovibrio sp.]|uniref:flagellar basal body L-ring protein FlgH n=1 Tax=Humidesulfovibrio sp. TaxID=2910988 RepID=UPI00273292EE|nr:flagellar basal body L-ring protein FlgH [Humidesulfovibrio sp.]MDP2847345.1 flagellar basal body L-ring protein FlgH [Humidesulfovibrio sp.]
MNARIPALVLFTLLVGCAAEKRPMPEPILSQLNNIEPEPVNNPASLYEAGQSEFLFDDNRANRVGDIVMVTVTETTTGKHKADTTATKSNTNAYGISIVPKTGIYGTLSDIVPGGKVGNDPAIATNSASSFKSTGETKQESNLTAIVATRVIRILPGKVMQVEGARQIRINDETQILVVRGLLRQRDIDSKNTAPSSALADARIEVYGQGALSDKQRAGWMSRVIDNVWPF